MKSSLNADAGPRIKSASRWRSCALFLSGLTLILGLAATAYGKKPVKPPPEPPPSEAAPTIYLEYWNYGPEIYKVELFSTGAVSSLLFNQETYGVLNPSLTCHDGRWFAGSNLARLPGGSPPMYINQSGSGEYINTELVVAHETGATTKLITVPVDAQGLPETEVFFEFAYGSPRWFDGDSRIAIKARKVSLVTNGDGSYARNSEGSYEVVPVQGTGGIYVAEIEFTEVQGVDIPYLIGEPQLVPWTVSIADGWSEYFLGLGENMMDFSLSHDGSVMHYVIYTRAPDPEDAFCTLYEADFLTGECRPLHTEWWFDGVESSPDGSAVVLKTVDFGFVVLTNLDLTPKLIMQETPMGYAWSPDGSEIGAIVPVNRSRRQLVTVDPYAVEPAPTSIVRGKWDGVLGWRAAQ